MPSKEFITVELKQLHEVIEKAWQTGYDDCCCDWSYSEFGSEGKPSDDQGRPITKRIGKDLVYQHILSTMGGGGSSS